MHMCCICVVQMLYTQLCVSRLPENAVVEGTSAQHETYAIDTVCQGKHGRPCVLEPATVMQQLLIHEAPATPALLQDQQLFGAWQGPQFGLLLQPAMQQAAASKPMSSCKHNTPCRLVGSSCYTSNGQTQRSQQRCLLSSHAWCMHLH